MRVLMWKRSVMSSGLVMIAVWTIGCADSPRNIDSEQSGASELPNEQNTTPADDHSGWWCAEHGVPEAECAQCDSSLIARFKQEGDWCEEHERPESQCFLCDASRFEKFAARYEAKFGEKPVRPPE